jgi:uncharacterized RDD family membrane protein YckC
MQTNDNDLKPADLSERVVAFAVDAGLFGVLYLVSFWLAFPGYPIVAYKPAEYWHFPWIAAFVLYQAFFSADGRTSVGKSILGLRVVDAQGEPLPLDQSLIRSLTYLVSCVGGLGFAWPLFNSAHQAWHDLPVGSVVVRERTGPQSPLVKLASAGCLSLLALAFYWEAGWGARYHQVRDLADAQVGFAEISELERTYHVHHGRYATSLFQLAEVSIDGQSFLRDMANLYDLDSGFEIKEETGRFVVRAVAQDENRTPLKFVGS